MVRSSSNSRSRCKSSRTSATRSLTEPRLPLDAGSYQISLDLVTPDPDSVSRRVILLDGLGWLDGNGIALEVNAEPHSGLTLPARCSVAAQ